jgi:hypothetical protein
MSTIYLIPATKAILFSLGANGSGLTGHGMDGSKRRRERRKSAARVTAYAGFVLLGFFLLVTHLSKYCVDMETPDIGICSHEK